jgi:hypothetical protein
MGNTDNVTPNANPFAQRRRVALMLILLTNQTSESFCKEEERQCR